MVLIPNVSIDHIIFHILHFLFPIYLFFFLSADLSSLLVHNFSWCLTYEFVHFNFVSIFQLLFTYLYLYCFLFCLFRYPFSHVIHYCLNFVWFPSSSFLVFSNLCVISCSKLCLILSCINNFLFLFLYLYSLYSYKMIRITLRSLVLSNILHI